MKPQFQPIWKPLSKTGRKTFGLAHAGYADFRATAPGDASKNTAIRAIVLSLCGVIAAGPALAGGTGGGGGGGSYSGSGGSAIGGGSGGSGSGASSSGFGGNSINSGTGGSNGGNGRNPSGGNGTGGTSGAGLGGGGGGGAGSQNSGTAGNGGNGGDTGYTPASTASISLTGNYIGGAGGTGGAPSGLADGGGGGGGGDGVAVSATSSSISVSGILNGGRGGDGGPGGSVTAGGGGGGGGSGFLLLGDTNTISFNAGANLTGGSGGTGGISFNGVNPTGSVGNGGVGAYISGDGNTVINAGTITGGLSGDGARRANAITVTGSNNTVELRAGYSLTGNVVATGGSNNTLALGGATGANFNVSSIVNAVTTTGPASSTQYAGFSAFSKVGAGSWSLTGSYTGTNTLAWSVNAGKLDVNASMSNSIVTVNSGGTLSGTGTVGATAIASGGTLAADTLGSGLTVNGNLSFASGSSYRVAAANTGASGLTSVNGNLTIASGSTLQMVASAGSYTAGTRYTIATYTGTETGSFSTLNHNFAFLTPTVSYGAGNVSVLLNTSGSFQTSGFSLPNGSTNQRAVANVLTRIYAAGGNAFTQALLTASDSQARSALAAASGDVAGAAVQNAGASIQSSQQAIGQRLAAVDSRPGGPAIDEDPWISVSLTRQHRATGDSGASAYDNNGTIVSFGHDYMISPDWLAGFAFSANSDRTSYRDVASDGRSDGVQAALYARYRPEGQAFFVKGMAGLGWWSSELSRQLSVGTFSSNVRGKYNVRSSSLYGEAGYTLQGAHVVVEPYAGLSAALTWRPAYTEATQSGSDGFALAYGGQRSTQTTSILGLRLRQAPPQDGSTSAIQWQADLAWRHRLGADDSTVQAAFVNHADDSFTVRGSPQGRDEAFMSAGASIPVAPTAAAFGQLGAALGKGYQSYGIQVGVRWWW